MSQTTIAIVCDCDDTLAPDTTEQLLSSHGIDPREFFKRCASLVDVGHDPALAYMNKILLELPDLTIDEIRSIGKSITLYPGIPDIFIELENEVETLYRNEGIQLRKFIISGGIKDLIAASSLSDAVDQIWGCNFAYDENGKIKTIKNVVSFTEKTRFLYNIQKGLWTDDYNNQPYAVNIDIQKDQRPIPFKNVIYLGDGPSDIPCMSIIMSQGEKYGTVIGLLNDKDPNRTWALGHGRRTNICVPPDFSKNGKWAYKYIRQSILKIADRIKIELERERDAPISRY